MRSRALLGVVVGAVATILLADAFLSYLVPPERPREVAEGIRDLAASDPATLVIGSSHARIFHALALELQARLGASSLPMVAIPLENGKLVPYQWLLENRVAPLIDEAGADGTPARTNLEKLVLVTEWWDSCDKPDGVYWNLPSRTWTLRDYARDVSHNGITSYNRNYVQTVIRRSFSHSALIVDRTVPRIKAILGRRLFGIPFPRTPEEERTFLEGWRVMVEDGVRCIGAPAQMAALERIIDFAQSRNLHVTLVLFPRKPATLSERAKGTTLAKFRDLLQSVAARRGVDLVDLTTSSPLTDGDFMADYDHVNVAGNQKFARWALKHHFRFLLKHESPADEPSPRMRVTP